MTPGGRTVGALLLACVLAGAFPAGAAAEDTVAFTIRDKRITESSGLARDVPGGIYWTVDDSGADGVAYGLGPDGKVRGTLRYRAAPTDVEAVALHDNRLYVADIGDNAGSRPMISVYYFLNPRATGLTVTYNAYDFRYADGPHDAETLLVDDAGRLYVVTKGTTGGGIYAAPTNPSRTATNVLRRVGDAPALVTDGVFLPDGQGLALLTYGSIEILDPTSYAPVASAPIPAQRQAESLTLDLAGDALLVGSEGRASKVYSVAIPGAATPSATPTATPSDSGADESDPDAAGRTRHRPAAAGAPSWPSASPGSSPWSPAWWWAWPVGPADSQPSRSTTQSMHWLSRLMSSGSTLGNMPTRSWLRPSLR